MRHTLTTTTALILLAACAHYGNRALVRVAAEHGDTATALASTYDEHVRHAVEAMDRGDPHRHWVYVGTDVYSADRTVHHSPEDRPLDEVGFESGHSVFIQPSLLGGGLMLDMAILHGLEHTVPGFVHICHDPHELPDARHPQEVCSPVGWGVAVGNPYTRYWRSHLPCNPFGTVCVGHVPLTELTELDRAELTRHPPVPATPARSP